MSTENAKPNTPVDGIVIQLSRIADALERLVEARQPEPTATDELAELLRDRYKDLADEIIEIVRTHKTDKAIVKALKAVGIVAKSSYWKDVNFYRPIMDRIAGER